MSTEPDNDTYIFHVVPRGPCYCQEPAADSIVSTVSIHMSQYAHETMF